MDRLRSFSAVFGCDAEGSIVAWNPAAESLTGVPAEQAIGQRCWEVIAGNDVDGGIVCHPGCSTLRLARQGWPVRPLQLDVCTPHGARRFSLSTIIVGGQDPLILHQIDEAVDREPAPAPEQEQRECPEQARPNLTRRQREILVLLSGGVRAREIAMQLNLSEATVRNHIQAILFSLGVHSQLEAVARARVLALTENGSSG